MKTEIFTLLFIGVVVASVNAGCEMKSLNSDCQDKMTECIDCMTMQSCRLKCDDDKDCKGYLYAEDKKRCNLWYGTECDQTIETKYWEKVCDGKPTISEFETKMDEDDDFPENCIRSCPRFETPRNILHNMKNTNVGSTITFYCQEGKLVGNRQITCRADGSWSDQPPRCIPT